MRKLLPFIALLLFLAAPAKAQQWAVSTNSLDYLNFGTLNAEGSVAVSRRIVLDVGAKFNPWTFGNRSNPETIRQNRQRMVHAGVQWYPWFIYDGWHFDAFAAWKEYNIGGIFSQTTEEGDAFGGGIGVGYTLPIHKSFNLDFGAAMWMGAKTYTVYSCPVCGKFMEQGTKFFIMPTNVTIGAKWIFGSPREKKAGRHKTNYVEL